MFSSFLKFNNRKIFFAIIILIFLLNCLLDIFFISQDKTPYSWDQSGHLEHSMNMYDSIRHGNYLAMIKTQGIYPPMFYILSMPLVAINKYPPFPIYINLFFLSIFIFSIYLISKEFFGNMAGILAAFIASASPLIVQSRRTYLLDFPVNAMVALTCLLVVKTKGFTSIKYALLAGFVSVLSVLTKQSAALFILPFVVCNIIFDHANINKSVKPLLYYIISILVLIIPYLLLNFKETFIMLTDLPVWAYVERDPQGFTFESFKFYLNQFTYQYTIVIRLGLVISSIYLFIKEKYQNKLFLFFSIIIGAYILLSLNPNKDGRYGEPLVIFIAIIIGGGISIIQNFFLKTLLSSGLILYCCFSLFTITVGWPTLNVPNYYPDPVEPNKQDWKIEQVLTDLRSEISKQTTMLIISDHPYVNCGTYTYYARLYQVPLTAPCPPIEPTINNFNDLLKESDYVMIIDDVTSMKYLTPIYGYVISGYEIFDSKISQYRKIHQYKLPNNLNLLVYKKL